MYSDKEHERVSIAKTKETENIGTSAENGRAMESKPKVGTYYRYQTAIAIFPFTIWHARISLLY